MLLHRCGEGRDFFHLPGLGFEVTISVMQKWKFWKYPWRPLAFTMLSETFNRLCSCRETGPNWPNGEYNVQEDVFSKKGVCLHW